MTSTRSRRASAATRSSSQRRRRVQLEAQPRVLRQPRVQPVEARRVADPDRRHEVDRARCAADGGLQRQAVLAQREIERRALERPAAVEAGALADRRDREQVGQAEQRRQLVERAGAVQPAQLAAAAQQLDLVDLVPRDVLALAGVGPAAETHDELDLREPARRVAHERLQLTPVDDDRQPGDARVRRADRTVGRVHAIPIAPRYGQKRAPRLRTARAYRDPGGSRNGRPRAALVRVAHARALRVGEAAHVGEAPCSARAGARGARDVAAGPTRRVATRGARPGRARVARADVEARARGEPDRARDGVALSQPDAPAPHLAEREQERRVDVCAQLGLVACDGAWTTRRWLLRRAPARRRTCRRPRRWCSPPPARRPCTGRRDRTTSRSVGHGAGRR